MLVYDAAYGDRARPDLGDAFWLIESPANRRIARQAWDTGSTHPNSSVFKGPSSPSAQDLFDEVEDIDLHHPGWTEIVVIGLEPTAELTSLLEAEGRSITRTPEGFSVRR